MATKKTAKKAASPYPPHIAQFLENVAEVGQLLAIHKSIGGTGPGRRHDIEVLNKSAVVLVVACWEAYVEDLASVALDYLITNAKDHTVFPTNVLERVSSKHSGPKAWSLAGDGWKKAMRDNYTELLAKTSGVLNTPRTAPVDELFLKSIGIASMSSHWHWKGRTQPKAVAALDALVTLRCSIAHRVQHTKSVRKSNVIAAKELVSFLAAISSNAVRNHLHSAVGTYPWRRVTHKKVG
jgi:hypothetical protein